MRPIDDHHSIRRDQYVVGADVAMNQGIAARGLRPFGFDVRQPVDMTRDIRLEPFSQFGRLG
jgi:hypothetical protein